MRTASSLLVLSLALAPLVGVGSWTLLTGRALGTGIQPAYLSVAMALILVLPRLRPSSDPDAWRLLAALSWTVLGVSALWTLSHAGMAGEQPWSKGSKQALLLIFYGCMACLPAIVLRDHPKAWDELRRWERGASVGLALVSAYGLYQAAAFYFALPGEEVLGRAFSSNPSIASGSDELYLGHRFVGIPRVRATACEPLYFGNYLLMAVPVTVAAALFKRSWASAWRWLASALGFSCLLLTFARGVYLSAAVLVLLLMLGSRTGRLRVGPMRRWIGWGSLLLVASLVAVSLVAGVAPWELPMLLLRRMAQSFAGHDLSNLTRLHGWRAALVLWREHPFDGIGWGGFGFEYFRVAGPGGGAAAFGWPMTNSLPLRFLAETGSVGAVLWAMAAWRPLTGFLDPAADPGRQATAATALCFLLSASFVAMAVQTLTFSQLNLPHFWLGAGVAAAVVRERERLV